MFGLEARLPRDRRELAVRAAIVGLCALTAAVAAATAPHRHRAR